MQRLILIADAPGSPAPVAWPASAPPASYGISYVYMDRYLARRGIPPLILSAGQLIAAALLLAVVLQLMT